MATEHQRWITKLMGYEFEVQYKLGLENKVVNALSPPTRRSEISHLIHCSCGCNELVTKTSV